MNARKATPPTTSTHSPTVCAEEELMKKRLKYLVMMASFQLTTILLMGVPAPAAEISRIPFSFQGSFDFPAGSVCNFNQHGEFLVEGYTKEQRDSEGIKKTIDHVTIHET